MNNLKREEDWLRRDKYANRPLVELKNLKAFNFDLIRLRQGEPLDYVIGWRDFLGCRIDLSFRPLIPREETAFWAESAIQTILAQQQENQTTKLRILDLFAGSGCLGLAVLKHCPGVELVFGDKEEKFIRQIKKNLKLNNLSAQTRLMDIFSDKNLSNKLGQFDFILANPPYIASPQKLSPTVKNWEPSVALFAGQDGLVIIKKFLRQAKDYLKSNGQIYLEFGYGQKIAVTKLLKPLGYQGQFFKDQFGRWRWVLISLT